MKILLTNDDGYNAPGIIALYERLSLSHEVILIAPDREKSAVSHGITLNEPMRINPIKLNDKDKGYAVCGTPADCVKLGLFELCHKEPDLVVSGINPGSNTGVNINYSGTVAAAREAAFNGISSMAVSIFSQGPVLDFKGMSQFTARIADKIHAYRLPPGTFLNINAPCIPVADVKGVKITCQALNNVSRLFEKRMDPKNRPYYWYGRLDRHEVKKDTDVKAVFENYISITPIQCDMTDHKAMEKIGSVVY